MATIEELTRIVSDLDKRLRFVETVLGTGGVASTQPVAGKFAAIDTELAALKSKLEKIEKA